MEESLATYWVVAGVTLAFALHCIGFYAGVVLSVLSAFFNK